MNWPAVFLSVIVVAPAVASSQNLSTPSDNKDAKRPTLTLRACVQQGTHGSMGNLNQVQVITPGSQVAGPRRVMYWFDKNVKVFAEHAGQLVEITGTVSEVLDTVPELKATDGVFAEVQIPAASEGVVATSGSSGDKPVATAGTAGTSERDDLPTTVVKAEVNNLKMIASCR